MASIYTFSLTASQQAAVASMLSDLFVNSPSVESVHNIFTKIVNGSYIAETGDLTIMGKGGSGCSPASDTWTGATAKHLWASLEWFTRREECWTDLESSIMQWGKKYGMERGDMTADDYMAYVTEHLGNALADYMWRLAWFSDTAADNYSGGGKITNGVSPTYFTILDGFWKLMFTQVGVDPLQRVTVAGNSEASYALQDSVFTPTVAYNTLVSMYDKATVDTKILESGEAIIPCTRSFADRWAKYLVGTGITQTYENLINGNIPMTFMGIPLIPIAAWDKTIRNYQGNGTVWYLPHRAVLTTKSNLLVGTKAESLYAEIDIFYDKPSKKNYIDVTGDIDVALMYANRFIAAY